MKKYTTPKVVKNLSIYTTYMLATSNFEEPETDEVGVVPGEEHNPEDAYSREFYGVSHWE